MATRLIRPVTMFSSSLDVQEHTIRGSVSCMPVPSCDVRYAHYLLSFLHSRQFCCCVIPSLNIWAVRVAWPASSPTATLSSCLLIAWSSFVLLGRVSLIRFLDRRQPLQVFHLFTCFCLKWLLMTSLPTTKRIPRSKWIKIFVWKWEIQGTDQYCFKGFWGKETYGVLEQRQVCNKWTDLRPNVQPP
jgi:hypothetical protein